MILIYIYKYNKYSFKKGNQTGLKDNNFYINITTILVVNNNNIHV